MCNRPAVLKCACKSVAVAMSVPVPVPAGVRGGGRGRGHAESYLCEGEGGWVGVGFQKTKKPSVRKNQQ